MSMMLSSAGSTGLLSAGSIRPCLPCDSLPSYSANSMFRSSTIYGRAVGMPHPKRGRMSISSFIGQ